MSDDVTLTAGDVVERLWCLNDMLRARWLEIRGLPYDPAFEAELDRAIGAFFEGDAEAVWKSLHPKAWRVLLERQRQAIMVGQLNKDVPFTTVPRAVLHDELKVHLALFVLRGMALPLPASDRSLDEAPEWQPSPAAKGH